MQMSDYKYKFSIVVPVYNVEDYVEETILSVINQTIGFEENIQLIIVNDGSPDNSHVICDKYAQKYPNNIIHVKQENGGVSSARNNGMQYVEGKYVNFLDSDDKWQDDACERVWKFFENHGENIDVVACRLEYFEAATGFSHPLNFKFTGDKIVHTQFDYNCIQMHMASCFIRSSALKFKFNTNLKYGEDSLFINQIILQKQRYGIMRSVSYLYRKRANESSAIDTCQQRVVFYDSTLVHFHDNILNYAREMFGKIPYYVQCIVMYDFQWRIKRPIPEGVLTEEEKNTYIRHVKDIMKNIDNFIITEQKNIWTEHKVYALNLKNDRDIRNELVQRKNELFYGDVRILSIKNNSLLKFSEIYIRDGILHLEGLINVFLLQDSYVVYFVDADDNRYDFTEICDYKKLRKNCLEGEYYYERYFKADIPVKGDNIKIRAKFQFKDNFPRNLVMNFTNTCNLNKSCNNFYFATEDYLMFYKNEFLCLKKKTKKSRKSFEKKLEKELWKKSKRITLYRRMYFILSKFMKKDIWIISDRTNKAGDNGEAFFRYMQTVKNPDIKTYFVLEKNSEDYKKMKKVGKILKFDSMKYKLWMLLSSHVISSQASDYTINPFGGQKRFVADLYNFKFTFLQHGITKDDISTWLNKMNKNIKCFVTAGKPEYKSIVEGDYYYGEDVVQLTGFPRHDNLLEMKDSKQKKILIIPTWRKSLDACVDPSTDMSVYYEGFKESAFFDFYNSLINDKRLIESMRKHGYTGLFCLHPLFAKQSVDFTANDVFKVNDGYVEYQKEFAEGSLLVTDYSSVFFDFAYLKKPVVYAHFDKEEFFGSHTYEEGYFSYEEDGFGPVCYDLDSTVTAIVDMIENDCALKQEYESRIMDFYIDMDGKNSERIYEAVKKLQFLECEAFYEINKNRIFRNCKIQKIHDVCGKIPVKV